MGRYQLAPAGVILKSRVVERDGKQVREIQKARLDEISLIPVPQPIDWGRVIPRKLHEIPE